MAGAKSLTALSLFAGLGSGNIPQSLAGWRITGVMCEGLIISSLSGSLPPAKRRSRPPPQGLSSPYHHPAAEAVGALWNSSILQTCPTGRTLGAA